MTVPSGVVYAVVHGGVTLGGFANTGDLFIDILKNGVSLGIGSTTKNIGISTVARTSVTTGVVEVSLGDYFELAIEVIQDTSVSLQSIGTFFSCHASSTEIGGSSPDTNDYVSAVQFGVSGQDVTLTLDRTGALPSISGTFTAPGGGGGGGTAGPFLTELASGNVDVTDDAWPTQANSLDFTLPADEVLAFKVGRGTGQMASGGLAFIQANDILALQPDAYGGAITNSTPLNIFTAEGENLYLGVYVGRTSSNKILLWSYLNDLVPVTIYQVGSSTGGGGLSEADADARYLQLIGGTLTGPGRLTIDVAGNNEALVINHHGGLSESALHAFTNTTGAQKAMQASRSNQSTAWFSIEGSLGGGNTKPGIAFGGGTGARDTELYRDSANNWKTPDWFTAQGFSITGAALSTWNSFGIANVLNGPPTLSRDGC